MVVVELGEPHFLVLFTMWFVIPGPLVEAGSLCQVCVEWSGRYQDMWSGKYYRELLTRSIEGVLK